MRVNIKGLSSKRKKYYLVVSEKNQHTYGAFNHTPEGFFEAERYVKKISKVNKTAVFIIKEK
tara:strand:+ start:228 stop:413 length:186 start_codon:yes stop_codon:yes gene_type:complete